MRLATEVWHTVRRSHESTDHAIQLASNNCISGGEKDTSFGCKKELHPHETKLVASLPDAVDLTQQPGGIGKAHTYPLNLWIVL